MKKIKASQILIPTVYLMGIAVIALCLVAVGKGIKNYSNELDNVNVQDVFDEKDNTTSPTDTQSNKTEYYTDTTKENSGSTIIKPYNSEDVILSKSYYDENADEKSQENSIIFYGNTYVQNMGSEYSSDKEFDVIDVIDGTVSKITKDETLGYIVEIKHENELVTVYEYLKEVNVKEGTTILKGDTIGVSGKSVVSDENKYTLHFEVYHKGSPINPENLYTMKVEDFK